MSIARDIKRKRTQHEREIAKAKARPHKIHRRAFTSQGSTCGLWYRSIGIVDGHVFSCLPLEAQCRNCRLIEPRAFRDKWRRLTEATDEERVAVECLAHAFAAFCVAVDESGAHADRGCYHRDIGEPCWCGSMSLMDPNMGEWAIAALFGIADDGFVFRNVCERCHLSFRTKHPRGPHPVCGFCRGTIANEADCERFGTGVIAVVDGEWDTP